MTLEDFRALVRDLQHEIPDQFDRGVVDVEISPKTVPHPVLPDIHTLGECIPLSWTGDGSNLQSRIVLYYGSFQALARTHPGFDWREEAWDTLTHELRHHLELRAHVDALEVYDWAAEQNFARHEGRAFDPLFYRSGERIADGVYKVDDDVFIEGGSEFAWHGRRYRAPVAGVQRPAFLTLAGLSDAPHGDAVLVFPPRASIKDLWRRPVVVQDVVRAQPIDG
ncbi:MAG TPA: metallopeptidase family protein [Gemmatimonadales bacterium]